jgi:hypothetical protein
MGFRQADQEPTHFEIGQMGASGVMEGGLVGDLPRDASDQILQVLGFPAIQAGVVHFHQSFQVSGSDDKLIGMQKGEDFFPKDIGTM